MTLRTDNVAEGAEGLDAYSIHTRPGPSATVVGDDCTHAACRVGEQAMCREATTQCKSKFAGWGYAPDENRNSTCRYNTASDNEKKKKGRTSLNFLGRLGEHIAEAPRVPVGLSLVARVPVPRCLLPFALHGARTVPPLRLTRSASATATTLLAT